MMFGFSLMRLGIYGAIAVFVLGGLYTSYRIWRHSIWLEGKNAVIEVIEKQNATAAAAARRVDRTIDQCFDEGGGWNVSTGKCDLDDITTPAGSGLGGLLPD